MNIPTTTTKGEQAKVSSLPPRWRSLASMASMLPRAISLRWRANIAAITYYFGSKEDLYLACAQWIADFLGENFAPMLKSGASV